MLSKYEKLNPVKDTGFTSKDGTHIWEFTCDCGNEIFMSRTKFLSGLHKCCGCTKILYEGVAKSYHPYYQCYRDMISRCYRKKDKKYFRYGQRGIRVCDKWRESFRNFIKDMGERPEGYTIDRINNDKNYEPNNCRWTDNKTQSRNRGINSNNSSGYRGVSYNKLAKKYSAYISDDYIKEDLGLFDTAELAASAYNKRAKQLGFSFMNIII